MKSLFPMIPFIASLSLLACQGSDDPVAEGAAAVPDSAIGGPGNAAAAEAHDRAAGPASTEGLVWTTADGGKAASFGPAGANAMLALSCRGEGKARRLLVTRLHPATGGATATMSFTGGGHASSLPMRAVAKPGGPGESEWQGEARGDMARAVARAFAGRGQVNVTLGGAPPLSVPASPLATALLQRCS